MHSNSNLIVFLSVIAVACILAAGGIALSVMLRGNTYTHPCEQPTGRNDPRCIGWYTRNH